MYNNPFYRISVPSSLGIKKGLFNLSHINWGNLLSNTQKTLGIINQTIPIIYQIKPIFSNAKTMLRIASSLKDTPKYFNEKDDGNQLKSDDISSKNIISNDADKPIFFI